MRHIRPLQNDFDEYKLKYPEKSQIKALHLATAKQLATSFWEQHNLSGLKSVSQTFFITLVFYLDYQVSRIK